MTDLKQLKYSVNMADIIGRYVPLRKDGIHFLACCPFHSEKSQSFTVTPSKQMWKCFGCGKGGDIFDFVMQHENVDFKQALKLIEDPNNINATPISYQSNENKTDVKKWTAIIPVVKPIPPIKTTHFKHGEPSKTWVYRDSNGDILCLVSRYETPDGKVALPMTYCTDGEKSEWRFQGLDRPRPIYGLDKLAANPNAPVFVFEGEKTADAGQNYFQKNVCITWIGGASNPQNTDWSVLKNRIVFLWPDNDKDKVYKSGERKGEVMDFHDQPGNKAMLYIASVLKDTAKKVYWINNSKEFPCGWDIADADWTREQAIEYAKKNYTDVPKIENEKPVIELPPPQPPVVEKEIEDKAGNDKNNHFKFLGYTKGGSMQHYHFFSYASKMVVNFTPSQMSKSNLMQIAPINFWESVFPSGGKSGGVDTDAAQNYLIQVSHRVGVYSGKYARGRGAWIDGKNIVLHQGNQLIVNGTPKKLEQHKSRFIYEIGEEMGFSHENPLNVQEAHKFLELTDMLNWERSLSSYLLAGWCVIAPVCGALTWRPHAWLTGAAGTGKTWIIEKIVRRMLGESSLSVQGETTEPGLRQVLGSDAIPVIFDEAEGQDKRAQERMQNVLSLARAASSNDGGLMAKGSASGTAVTYSIRSCFFFSSIVVQISNQADAGRIKQLTLQRDITGASKEKFQNIIKKYNEFFNDEYCSRMRARTVSMLPTILKNTEIFANAAASHFNDQRTGDQLGSMLAGAFSLTSNRELTYDEAVEWMNKRNWNEEKLHDSDRDENALLECLMNQMIRVETGAGAHDRAIGELIQIGARMLNDSIITDEMARDKISRIGINIGDGADYIIISNSSPWIKKTLADTPWGKNHNKILMRLTGAKASDGAYFKSGLRTRAVLIPYRTIFN